MNNTRVCIRHIRRYECTDFFIITQYNYYYRYYNMYTSTIRAIIMYVRTDAAQLCRYIAYGVLEKYIHIYILRLDCGGFHGRKKKTLA